MDELPPIVTPYPRENNTDSLERLIEADAATKKAAKAFLLMFVLQNAFYAGALASGDAGQAAMFFMGMVFVVYFGLGAVVAVLAYRATIAYSRYKGTDMKGMAILVAVLVFLPCSALISIGILQHNLLHAGKRFQLKSGLLGFSARTIARAREQVGVVNDWGSPPTV